MFGPPFCRVKPEDVSTIMTGKAATRNEDIIIRPETNEGCMHALQFHIIIGVDETKITQNFYVTTGWEFHAYLVRKTQDGNTIYEPKDKTTEPLQPTSFGILRIKEAYHVHVQRKHIK